MYRLKREYRDQDIITALPTGEAVCLSGQTVSRELPGSKENPPETKEIRGITDADLKKHKDDPGFKGIFERYFEKDPTTKSTQEESKSKPKSESKKESKSKDKEE